MADEELEQQDTTGSTETDEADGAPEGDNRRARRAAASQARKNRMRERREAEAVGLDAGEMLDDALVRSGDSAGKWLRRNSHKLQWLLVGGLLSWAAWGLYGVSTATAKAEASDSLATALRQQAGRVGDEDKLAAASKEIDDPTPVFADDAARVTATHTELTKSVQLQEGSGTNGYARLALASILLDQGKVDEALQAYQAVGASDLSSNDPQLRASALEGVALSQEAKGDEAAATATYKQLEDSGIKGYATMALYQQIRILADSGKVAEAKKRLAKLNELLDKSTLQSDGFLKPSAEELTRRLDPEAAAKASAASPITPEKLKQLQAQVQRQISQQSKQAKNKKPPAPRDTPVSAPPSTKP